MLPLLFVVNFDVQANLKKTKLKLFVWKSCVLLQKRKYFALWIPTGFVNLRLLEFHAHLR